MSLHRRGRVAAVLLLVGAAIAGCGDDGKDASDSTATTAESTTSEPTSTSGGSASTVPGDLPGEEAAGPAAGTELAVVGVRYDDVLNVRSAPGADAEVVEELPPLSTGVVATGASRSVDGGVWDEITANGVTGWANTAYLSSLGDTTDITAEVVAANGGAIPTAADTDALGAAVAASRSGGGGDGGEGAPQVVVVAEATEGDLGEITLDVIGLADDSVEGERLVVFATPQADGTVSLKSVEMTVMCARGSSGGACT